MSIAVQTAANLARNEGFTVSYDVMRVLGSYRAVLTLTDRRSTEVLIVDFDGCVERDDLFLVLGVKKKERA